MDEKADDFQNTVSKISDFSVRLQSSVGEVLRFREKIPSSITEEKGKIILTSLALLCRSLSNFKASFILINNKQYIEARSVTRMIFENALWIAALRDKGKTFIAMAESNDEFNKNTLAKITLTLSGKHGGDINSDTAKAIRDFLRMINNKKESPKKLNCQDIAEMGVIELSYIDYIRLSLDSTHCSLHSLGKHLVSSRKRGINHYDFSVVPELSENEILETLIYNCHALIMSAIGVNDILKNPEEYGNLSSLLQEFYKNNWRTLPVRSIS